MRMNPNDIKVFVEWMYQKISAYPFKEKQYNYNKRVNIESEFAKFQSKKPRYKNHELSAADIQNIIKEIDLHSRIAVNVKGLSLADAVKLFSENKESEHAFLSRIRVQGLKNKPKVYFGPSSSLGHYDPTGNRIYIDPRKNKTRRQQLNTLAYETINASNRASFSHLKEVSWSAMKKAEEHIKIEYETNKKELNILKHSLGASSISELVDKMGITQEDALSRYVKSRPSYNLEKIKREKGVVKMPPTTALKGEKRTALFWYLVRDWNDNQILDEYKYREHTPGGGISTLEQEIKNYS